MREEVNLYGLIMLILSITVLSAISVNFILIQYGVTNDYIFDHMQNLTETLQNQGAFTINISNITLTATEHYQDSIEWFDNLWFMVYVVVVMFTLYVAYKIKQPTELNFLMILLFGIFIFLFMGYLSDIFVTWFTNNITLKLMPNALEFFPKYSWFVNNIGLINVVHAVVLLLISRFNFQFKTSNDINIQELGTVDNEELN